MTLRAGFARRDITQPLGTPSSLGLFTAVTEIWDPLSATAVVLESDGERIALVGLDLCGLLAASHRSIRDAVAARTGLAADRVVLNVSHSHSAPYISADLQELLRPYGLRLHDDDYAASLQTAVAEAVAEAADTATPARVAVGRGLVERVAGNRRPKLSDGRTVHRYGRPPQELRDLPEGLIDPEVTVVRFDRPDGRPIGAILSYSCHPTASGLGYPTNVSADFVGHGRTKVEDPTGLTCVFLQGCAGDQGTGKWVSATPWEDTVAMGDRFARGVTEALATAHPVEEGELLVVRSLLPLDLDPMSVAELEARFDGAVGDRDSADIVAIGDRLVMARRLDELAVAAIVTIRLGPALAIVVLPGEVFLEHGLRIRAGSPFADTLVAAYNDSTLQYIPTEAAFPDGAYEVDGGWRYIRPGEGERLADEAVRSLESLRR
ncbi:MAG: neutral/alkaline non-lysosomal ceramidase N-terminal domain-containing protein [Chloroflexota bacterium]